MSNLIDLCSKGNYNEVLKIIEQDDYSYYERLRGFCIACIEGHTKIVKLLISKNSDELHTGLEKACNWGHIKLVKFLIKKGANDWNWGLEGACKGGNIKIVKLMVKKGANDWNSGLENACIGGHMKIVKLMIKKGADCWEWGLAKACSGGHMKIAKLMIKKGAESWGSYEPMLEKYEEYVSFDQINKLIRFRTNIRTFTKYYKFKEILEKIKKSQNIILQYNY